MIREKHGLSIYETKAGIPIKGIHDEDFDGIPDNWSFFKNGKAFLDQVDLNKDGKVDTIYLNIFTEKEDTGWTEKNKAP